MSIKDLKDEEIIMRLKDLTRSSGNHEGVEDDYYREIFRRYSSQAYSLCRYYGLKHDDAHDAMQEAFVKLCQCVKNFQEGRPFKPYFFKIILNEVRDNYTKRKKHYSKSLDEVEEFKDRKSENIFENLQNKEHIEGILNEIPEKHKEIAILKIYGDLGMEDIAQTLGISLRQAYYRLDEAFSLIKQKLERDYG